jgi:hypothetical protein
MPSHPHAYFCFATRPTEADLEKLFDWLGTCVGSPFAGGLDDCVDELNNGYALPSFRGVELLSTNSEGEGTMYLLTAGHQQSSEPEGIDHATLEQPNKEQAESLRSLVYYLKLDTQPVFQPTRCYTWM